MKIQNITLPKKPIYIKLAEDIDCYELFQKIDQSFSSCFILESLSEEGHLSRYSIIGFKPAYIIRAKGKKVFMNEQEYEVKNPYFALRDIIPQDAFSRNYAGGLVGYLGYDAVSYFEPNVGIKSHPLFDQYMFGIFTDGIIFDKVT